MTAPARCLGGLVLAAAGLTWAVAPPAGVPAVHAAVLEVDRLWTIGVSAFDDGLYDQAYRALGRFIAVGATDRRHGDARALRGKAALALGRDAEALTEFQAAQGLPTQAIPPGEALFWQAEALFRLKRFEEARDLYARFVAASADSPHAPDALYGRGLSELATDRPAAAIEAFQTVVERHPQTRVAPRAAYSAALELVRAKRWDEAQALLEPYATRYPASPLLTETRYLLGVTLIEKGRAADGMRALEAFLAAAPKHDLALSARMLLADSYEKAGRAKDAISQYQLVVKQSPNRELVPQALYQIGELNRRLGRVAETEAAWRTLRQEYPRDAFAALAGLGLVDLDLGRRQYDRAAAMAREVAEGGGPRRLEALALLGESALAGGNLKDAEAAFTRALGEAAGGSPEGRRAAVGLLLLGERAFKTGHMEDAARVYAAVRDAAPAGTAEHFRALAGMGLVSEARGAEADARQTYEAIVRSAPDRELVQWAEARLQSLDAAAKPAAPAAGDPASQAPARAATTGEGGS